MKMGPQEDYIETVFTCKGDFNDPNLHLQLEEFYEGLRSLLLPDSCQEKLILKKVEPWNSVRVTFNIPRAAALKLKQLAQQGDTNLRRLGVLAVQIEGDQSISLTIAGKNNERTELVFKTGAVDGSTEPSVSLLDTSSGTSGGCVETNKKNIADYLRPSNYLLDPLLSHLSAGSDLLKSPNVVATSSDPIPFLSGGNTTVSSSGKTSGLHNSPLHGYVFPPGRSPTGYPTSPGQGFLPSVSGKSNVGPVPTKYGTYPPHGRPGMHIPAMARPTIGNLLLPPPPPYPHSQVVSVNNVQKQNRPMTSSSPLLVNLLQNDPSGGFLNNIASGKFPDVLDGEALALAKKKRKKKKKKRLAAETAAREAEMQAAEGVPGAALMSTSSSSLPGFKKSVKKAKLSVSGGPTADHSTNLSDYVLDTAADKLVNPYTGLLEPADATGENTSGSTVPSDQPEKIDTIQAAINRVAAAWSVHVTAAEETVSTSTSSVLTSSPSSAVVTTPASTVALTSTVTVPSPAVSACSGIAYVSPLSVTGPAYSVGSADTQTGSTVCDRPTPDPHHRPYDMNYSPSNNSSVNDNFQREPLQGMQHVTFSVGNPSVPVSTTSLSPVSTSHMQSQLSMQEALASKHSCVLSRASISDQIDSLSKIGGLPGGHSGISAVLFDKSKNLPTPVSVEAPPLRRHAGTPPHFPGSSPPMTYQVERPRSTGSYPMPRAVEGKALAGLASSNSPHVGPGGANVSVNPGLLSIENKQTHIRVQPSVPFGAVTTASNTQGQKDLPFIGVTQGEGQPVDMNPKTEMPRKGSDEISNSNHDSGLSSQSEAADDNQLTDETTSSCGTQGSPLLVTDAVKVERDRLSGNVEPQGLKPVVLPTSSQPTSTHKQQHSLAGNPHHLKDTHVQTMVNSAEVTPHNPTVVSKNPTVLHWNTRDNVASGSHVSVAGNKPVSAERDSRESDKQAELSRKLAESEASHSDKCQSPEHTKSLQSVKEGPVSQGPDVEASVLISDFPRVSVTVSCVTELRETSHVQRDKGIFSMSQYRTYSYTSGASSTHSGVDALGNYHRDVGRSVPIMSASVYQGGESKAVGESAKVKPQLQSSAIGVVPSLPELRTAKSFDNTSSAHPESHADALTKRLEKPIASDGVLTCVSGSVPVQVTDSSSRLRPLSTHNTNSNMSANFSNSPMESHSVNSHGPLSVPVSSHWKETPVSRIQVVSTTSASHVSTGCRPSGNQLRSQAEALNSTPHCINALNVSVCHTVSATSTVALNETPTLNSTAHSALTTMSDDKMVKRTTHSLNPLMVRTTVSNSAQKISLRQVDGESNGPVEGVEGLMDTQNCHGSDIISHGGDVSQTKFSKSTNLRHSGLPVISTDILDHELVRNCGSTELQLIEDKVEGSGQTFLSAEHSLAVQRGILTGGKSPGLATAALQASSRDHLKGSNVTSMYTRKSPTSKTSSGGGGNMLCNMFASDLPLPKLLTESIQKVVKPLPGSAKDLEGVVKPARRNQGPTHTNLHSHNSSSSYSKSPPLGFDSLQGASSVLTPPKSPVRFGQGESLPMGLTRPQSPRTRSPLVSPAVSNPSPLPHGNIQAGRPPSSSGQARSAEHNYPVDNVERNGPEVVKSEQQYSDSSNSGPLSAQVEPSDSALVQSWNGANSQNSRQQQPLCQPSSVESHSATMTPMTATPFLEQPVSGDTSVSESNIKHAGGAEVLNATVDDVPSAKHSTVGESPGHTEQSGPSEHLKGLEGQDLCKAKLSCPSQTSIMHTESVLEGPSEVQVSGDRPVEMTCHVHEVNCRHPPVPFVALPDSVGIGEDTSQENKRHPDSTGGNAGTPMTGAVESRVLEQEHVDVQQPQTSRESSPTQADHVDAVVDKAESNDGMPAAVVEVQSATVTVNPPTVIQPESKDTADSNGPSGMPVGHPAGNDVVSYQGKTAMGTGSVLETKVDNNLETCKRVFLAQTTSESVPAENTTPRVVAENISNDQTDDEANQKAAQGPVSFVTHPGPNEANVNEDVVTTQTQGVPLTSLVQDGNLSSAVQLMDGKDLTPEAGAVDGNWVKPDEEPQRFLKSTRKTPESDSPVSIKSLRGGKLIEVETPRPVRLTKTPKRKEEDKTSPEVEASPHLRQRRSRRRLPDADGNANESPALKRQRVDGQEDSHTDAVDHDGMLRDGDSNDAASCDHNDIGEAVDHAGIDGAPVTNQCDIDSAIHAAELTTKNVGEDKAIARHTKDLRKTSEASKPVLRETRKDVKQNTPVTDNDIKGRGKAAERGMRGNEEEHVTRSSRRNRQSPSGVVDKLTPPASRDRSPLRGTRNRTPDQREESPDQQYKRTTRSTKPKELPEPVTTNRRRRTSRDHR